MQTEEELQAIRAANFSGMNNVVDGIYQSIITDAKKDLPMLPETIFKSYFLPYFAGQVAPANHVPDWISIAGAPTQQVNIIDNIGNVLFTVPALLSTQHIQRLRPEGALPFASIVAMAQALKTKSPTQSHNLFVSAMLERYRQVHDSDYQPTEDELAWLGIYTRYDVIPAGGETAAIAATEAVSDEIDDDDFKMG